MSQNLLREFQIFEAEDVMPSKNSDGIITMKGIIQKANTPNANKRIYPKAVLHREDQRMQQSISDRRALGELDHPDCLRPSAKILTTDGWKFIKDVDNNEQVFTLNLNTNKIESHKISRKIEQSWNGEMFSVKSRNIDTLVTRNHRFVIEDRDGNKFFKTAGELYDSRNRHWKFIKTGDWDCFVFNESFTLKGVECNYNTRLPHVIREKYSNDVKIPMDVWMSFMGYYLSEGNVSHNNGSYTVQITQRKQESVEKIIKIISQFPEEFDWKIRVDKNETTRFTISDKRLFDYLKPMGYAHEKFIPNELKNQHPEHLQCLFDCYLDGDGRIIETNGSVKRDIFSTSEKIIDDLYEILMKLGGSGSIYTHEQKDRFIEGRLIKRENSKPLHFLKISSSNGIYLDNRFLKIEKIENYNDFVYCVTVPNENFLCMDQGKVFWSGNSPVVQLENVSHVLTGTSWEGDTLIGEIEVLDTPKGQILGKLIERKIKLGISSRGLGSTKRTNEGYDMVEDDFSMICYDMVSNPSTSGAFMHLKEHAEFAPLFFENKIVLLDEILNDILRLE